MSFFSASISSGTGLSIPPRTLITQVVLADRSSQACVTIQRDGFTVCRLSHEVPNVHLTIRSPALLCVKSNRQTRVQVIGIRVKRRRRAHIQRAVDSVDVEELIRSSISGLIDLAPLELKEVAAGSAESCAVHLLLARRALLSQFTDATACTLFLARMLSNIVRVRDLDSSIDIERDQIEPMGEAMAGLAEAVKDTIRLAGMHGRGAPQQMRALIRLDQQYFQLMDLCQAAFKKPLAILGSNQWHQGASATSVNALTLLTRPGEFFLASQPVAWVRVQQKRWFRLLRMHSSQSKVGRDATMSRDWHHRVVCEHARLHMLMQHGRGHPLADANDATLIPNQLLCYWYARQLEAVALLHSGGIADSQEFDALLAPSARSNRDEDPPAPPLVQEWRHADRARMCEKLSYAVPSPEALALLAAHGPLVEMGSGTGYWAGLLARCGCDVTAFDVHPPELGGNSFHCPCPTFVPVLQGAPHLLADSKWKSHTLLLCYPPPRDRMALDCVLNFCGNVIAHIGEWLGDTGSLAFERELFRCWELKERLPLPSWGDTADDLTIWIRRAKPLDEHPEGHPLLVCGTCGAPARLSGKGPLEPRTASTKKKRMRDQMAAGHKEAKLLRRCRYCRVATYCSQECQVADSKVHAQLHAMKMITIERQLDFAGRDYYELRKPYVW